MEAFPGLGSNLFPFILEWKHIADAGLQLHNAGGAVQQHASLPFVQMQTVWMLSVHGRGASSEENFRSRQSLSAVELDELSPVPELFQCGGSRLQAGSQELH